MVKYILVSLCVNPKSHRHKKTPAIADAFLVEHLEKSSPLIVEEIRRWRDLIWDDYLEHKYRSKRPSDTAYPSGYTPHTPELAISGKAGGSRFQSPRDLESNALGVKDGNSS